ERDVLPQSNGQFVDSVPPSTSTTLPVTHEPAGEHSQRAASATSSTAPSRRIGVIASILWRISSVRNGRSADVSTAPTASAFTRTRGANSAASWRVMKESAAFAVPYATNPERMIRPDAGERLATGP